MHSYALDMLTSDQQPKLKDNISKECSIISRVDCMRVGWKHIVMIITLTVPCLFELITLKSCLFLPRPISRSWVQGSRIWWVVCSLSCNQLKPPISHLVNLKITGYFRKKISLLPGVWLTHWGRVMYICVGKTTIIGSDDGLSPGRRQAIIWTNAGILLIGTLGTNFSEILIECHSFSFKKMHMKMSSGKWRPSCLGLNVLMRRHHWFRYIDFLPYRWQAII